MGLDNKIYPWYNTYRFKKGSDEMTEKEIQKTMKALDISRDEAIAMLKEDEEIDRMAMGEVDNDLTAEQKKVKKAMTKTGEKKKTVYKFDKKKERKVDETKKHFLDCIRVLIEGMGAVVEPLKTEAEMHFTFGEDSYTIKLIKHRPPKTAE